MTRPTEVVPATPGAIARAAALIRAGGLVAFPTETVYGLGANALDPVAVGRIFHAKGRPATNPVIVHIAHRAQLDELVGAIPPLAEELASLFWPGPLTLVLPRGSKVPDIVTAGGPTVAVRVPAHPVAQELLLACGLPIAAPSANRSMCLSPTRAEHVLRGLDTRIDMILDAGPCFGGLESTVLDVTTQPPTLLRPGLLGIREIEALIGPVGRKALAGDTARSPGMMSRHYAPRPPIEFVSDDGWQRVQELLKGGTRVGWCTFGAVAGHSTPRVVMQTLPDDPAGYAARLYEALHQLDAAGIERIVIALPPEDDRWLAIHDRLSRMHT